MLREFVESRGQVSSCRLAPRPGFPGQMQLYVITKPGYWLRAEIDPNQTLADEAVTIGGSLDPKRAAEARSQGDACRVSRADGSLSLVK